MSHEIDIRELKIPNGDGTFTTFYEPSKGSARLIYDLSKVAAVILGGTAAISGYIAGRIIERLSKRSREPQISPF